MRLRAPSWLAWTSLVLITLASTLVAPDTLARPGGGSGFKSGRSSGGTSGSSSGSRPSGSRSSSSRSSSGSQPPGGPSPSPMYRAPSYAYCIADPLTRTAALQRRAPGTISPFPEGPHRPTNPKTESESSVLLVGVIGAILIGVGILAGAAIALILLISLFVWLGSLGDKKKGEQGWTTASSTPVASSSGALRRRFGLLRASDPDFSTAIFEDFVYGLYAELHTARGQRSLDRWGPYLKPAAREQLEMLGAGPVTGIVIGAMSYVDASVPPTAGPWAIVELEFEACFAEGGRSYYSRERWKLVRSASAKSRPPEQARVYRCPHCGAPLDRVVGNRCGYCDTVVDTGAFDWVVESIHILDRQAVPPVLTGSSEEEGTELPTVFDSELQPKLASLNARDPSMRPETINARIQLIFQTMQVAWSSLEWERARAFLSDSLFETNAYWIQAYRSQGLRNITEPASITNVELVRVDSDRWFDAITVRLHATSRDYTIRDSDRAIVGGDANRQRAYTEYWTLLRSAARRGPATTTPSCPNCGASFPMSMAAHCTHCGAKVNSGAFDWVLSRIEQDEVYGG